MRYIEKTNTCLFFENWKITNTPTNWNHFNDSTVKLALHQHLWKEQKGLCIYCQQSVPQKVSVNAGSILHPSHLEHIRPKDNHLPYTHLTFDHSNLSVSCDGFDVNDTRKSPDFCGHKKENVFDDALFLHPIEIADIESFFEYDLNGRIKPSTTKSSIEQNQAQYSIDLLNLKDATLKQMREDNYNEVLQLEQNGDIVIDDYLNENEPELPKFYSMLKQMFMV
jgi:uncharacterized protein (TIGR02646 family)